MRFALLEIKLTLIKLLQKYQIVPGDKTPRKLVFKYAVSTRAPIEPIQVVFKRR